MIKEPENMTIPSEEDFYYDGDVDERWALNHYLGKDLDFAEQRYYTLDPLSMVHDFTLVGCRAFRYYIFGAFRYLQSGHSKGEPDVYSALPEILDKKLSEDPRAFLPIAAYIIEFSQWAIENYGKFDVDPDIYGDVREGYRTLQRKMKALANAPI